MFEQLISFLLFVHTVIELIPSDLPKAPKHVFKASNHRLFESALSDYHRPRNDIKTRLYRTKMSQLNQIKCQSPLSGSAHLKHESVVTHYPRYNTVTEDDSSHSFLID